MSRAGIFRVSGGIAVDMNNRVFKLPSFYGTFFLYTTCVCILILIINNQSNNNNNSYKREREEEERKRRTEATLEFIF